MKLTDSIKRSVERSTRRAPEEIIDAEKALLQEARVQRRREQEAKIASARERLSQADLVLAEGLRVPRDRPGRVVMARELREGPPRRTQREVAAIMGVSYAAVMAYFNYPDGELRSDRRRRERSETTKQRREAIREAARLRAQGVKVGIPAPKRRDQKGERRVKDDARDVPVAERDEFARKLKQRRKAVGLSQIEFARRVGVSRTTVQTWEAADYNPSPEHLERIERVLSG